MREGTISKQEKIFQEVKRKYECKFPRRAKGKVINLNQLGSSLVYSERFAFITLQGKIQLFRLPAELRK